MDKIATEQEAYDIGETGIPNGNKCCTKQKALELGCKISANTDFAYMDNELIPLSRLQKPVMDINIHFTIVNYGEVITPTTVRILTYKDSSYTKIIHDTGVTIGENNETFNGYDSRSISSQIHYTNDITYLRVASIDFGTPSQYVENAHCSVNVFRGTFEIEYNTELKFANNTIISQTDDSIYSTQIPLALVDKDYFYLIEIY